MASSSSARQFDVFLNFSCGDSRTTLVSHLYNRLQSIGISTFEDDWDRELPLDGSLPYDLLKAIDESKIAVVVISENYASSSWCLNELQIIMERHEKGKLWVIPVYGVDPSHVRNQRGAIAEALENHQSRENPEKIQKWREALKEIGDLTGIVSREWEREPDLANDLARDISRLLLSVSPEDVGDIIGMDAQLEALYRMLSMGSDDEVRMIGIWGMGGVGKTTVARCLYSNLRRQFPLHCFFRNIKEIYNNHGREYLQRHFLYEIFHDENFVSTAFEIGSSEVMARLRSIKVLVILDDVDELGQLEALAKRTSWFVPGSRIIITSRDKGVLTSHGVELVHEVKCLDDETAIKLFTLYAFGEAFREDQIPNGFANLSIRASKLAGGLPQALKVLGKSLRRRNLNRWKAIIGRLRERPGGITMEILKVSYDGLDERNQGIFLTIACLLTEEQVNCVVHLLGGDEWDVMKSLYMLVEKSLIDFSYDGKAKVHGLVQNMAREIVRQQSIGEPGKRKLLCDAKEIYHVLDKGTGTDAIEGMSLNMPGMPSFPTRNRLFERMRKLRLLKIQGTITRREDFSQIRAAVNQLPLRLRLLDWSDCPLTALPPTFSANFLVELRLPHSHLEKLSDGTLILGNLRRMDLRWCQKLTEVPSLYGATQLEELDLSCCFSLVKSPSAFPILQKLARLSMRNCPRLEFPPDASGLKSLKVLDLRGCSSLKSFPKLSNSIMELYLGGTEIRQVPETIQRLIALEILDLSRCRMLSEISRSIDNLTRLRDLNLSDCESLMNMPDTVGSLTALKTLDLSGCQRLLEIPSTIGSLTALEKLDLRACEKVRNIPNTIGGLTALKELHLRRCENLSDIPYKIGSLTALKELNLRGCKKLKNIPDTIGNLIALKELNLRMCEKLGNIPSTIGGLTALETLRIRDCEKLSEIPGTIGNLTSLKEVYLWNCKRLCNIPDTIGNLAALKGLYLGNCENLENIPDTIGNLRALKHLCVLDCENLRLIPDTIGNLTALEWLFLSGCARLSEIPGSIENLTTLKVLDLSGCEYLGIIPERIGSLIALETLRLSGCQTLSMIPRSMGNLTALKELNLKECENLRTIPDTIRGLTALEGLDLRNCKKLGNIPDTIGDLAALRTLLLSGCEALSEIPDTIGNLTALETLSFSGCSMLSVSEIRNATANLTRLKNFFLPGDGMVVGDILSLKSGISRLDIKGLMEEEKISNLRRPHPSGCSVNSNNDEEEQVPNFKKRRC